MNHFSELQFQHEGLLRQENAGKNILKPVQTYIKNVRFKSSNVSSSQEREQLRANARYWASYVFAQTGNFPNTELTPFSGEMLKETAVVNTVPKIIMWAGGGIATIVILLLFAFLIFRDGAEADNSEEIAAIETKNALVAVTNAGVTQTIAAMETAFVPAMTPTPAPSTPIPTNTSPPTQAATTTPIIEITPTPVLLQSLKAITAENVKEIQQLAVLTGHTGAILDIDFNPNGQQIASSGEDGSIVVWDIDDNNLLSTQTIFQDWLQQSVTYNPNGKQIAIGGNDRVVTILNIIDTLPFAQFKGHEGFVFGLDYTPDGSQLASGDGNGVLKVWDVYSGGMFLTTELGKSAILELDFNQTQDLLAVANLNDGFKLLAYPSLRPLCSLGNDSVLTTAFASDGKFVVFGNKKGEVVSVDPGSRDCSILDTVQAHSDFVNSVALNSDGDIIVSGGRDGVVFVMPVGISLIGHTDSVESVAINPQGTIIASASADGTIILWGIPSK